MTGLILGPMRIQHVFFLSATSDMRVSVRLDGRKQVMFTHAQLSFTDIEFSAKQPAGAPEPELLYNFVRLDDSKGNYLVKKQWTDMSKC